MNHYDRGLLRPKLATNFRRFLIGVIFGSLAFGAMNWFLHTQLRNIDLGDSMPMDQDYGPWLPRPIPTLIVVVIPLLTAVIAAVSPLVKKTPHASWIPLLLLAIMVPVAVSLVVMQLLMSQMWMGHR